MAIISIEGPSAVGKSSVSAFLAEHYDWEVIPEVNLLFERPPDAEPFWYHQRQIDRLARATRISRSGGKAVLDGDPFQTIWYNRLFPEVDEANIDEIDAFFAAAVEDQALDFPQAYFHLSTDTETLRIRKEGDIGRRRGGFEKHLGMIEALKVYFETVSKWIPVTFLRNVEINETAKKIVQTDLTNPDKSFLKKIIEMDHDNWTRAFDD